MAGKTTKPAYLIAGDDSFTKEKKAAELIETLLPNAEMRGLSFEAINCSDLSADSFVDFADMLGTASFLDDGNRVLLLKNFEDLYIDNRKNLLAYLSNPAESSSLIMVSKDTVLGPKDLEKKTYSEITRFCEMINCFNPTDERSIKERLVSKLKKAGKSISDDAAAVVLDRANGDVREIESEAEKLILFAGKKEMIELADVKYLISDTDINEFWDLSSAIGRKDFNGSMSIFYNIFDHNRPESACLAVLGALYYFYSKLWNVRRMKSLGMGFNEIAGKLKMNPWMAEKQFNETKNLTDNEIKKAFAVLAKADMSVKTGRMPYQSAIERVIYNLTIS